MKGTGLFYEKVSGFIDFLKSKKPIAFVTLILISLSFSAFVLLFVYSIFNFSGKEKNAKQSLEKTVIQSVQKDETFSNDQKIVLPSKNEITDDYVFSRTPQSTWSKEEAKKWFTSPDKKNLEDLKKSNDNMILDVVGGAP